MVVYTIHSVIQHSLYTNIPLSYHDMQCMIAGTLHIKEVSKIFFTAVKKYIINRSCLFKVVIN